ncbi:MAG: DUF1847 domain-containing protein [Chloroflexi bacterium]|nr:DUF1847 domain-containing protein [Chloroflexota bacterium]
MDDKGVKNMTQGCAVCRVQACCGEPGSQTYPTFCPMSQESQALVEARAAYDEPETRELALVAARTEAAGYCKEPRVEEIINFARRLGISRLGIACCVGLLREARLFQEILEANGFEVHSLCCKVGSIPKEDIGLTDDEKIRPGHFEALCSPIGQARLLNAAATGLNVVVGLCVGHDSLFFQHSEAPVTVLVTKDRVTGHNPVAALYTSHSYYRRLRG